MRTFSYGVKSLTSATAEGIFSAIDELLKEDGLSLSEKLVGFGSDGANVMRGKRNSVLTRMKNAQPHLYSLHCSCHIANLCAISSCQAFLPPGFEEWLMQMAYFFDKSAKRTTALKQTQELQGLPQHKLVKPAQTRWLSLLNCVYRTLEQWDTLLAYFTANDDVKEIEKLKN